MNGIFTVWDKEEFEEISVYAVRDDTKTGYPQFLIYKNGEWMYKSAKCFCEA